nr:hypothetical protein [Actinomadura madurae]
MPTATSAMPHATAAAEPLEEPPGVRVSRHGFVVGPGVMSANSVVTVFPRTKPPASLSSRTTAASARGRWSA